MHGKERVMKKNTKSVVALAIVITMISAVFAACSAGADKTTAESASTENTIVSTAAEITTNPVSSTTKTNSETETTVKTDPTTTKSNGAAKSSSVKNTTAKKQTTTSKKKSTTTKKAATTKKKTTTTKKKTTAKKNVSAKSVQSQVNSYIKSKGIKLDSSMTPSNASWSGQISDRQDSLNDGTTLRNCKDQVDYEIEFASPIMSMYCYYDGSDFYILYW